MSAVNQHPARLPDRARPEAGAGPVRGADVERNAGDADRCRGVARRQSEKARRSLKVGRSLMRVGLRERRETEYRRRDGAGPAAPRRRPPQRL